MAIFNSHLVNISVFFGYTDPLLSLSSHFLRKNRGEGGKEDNYNPLLALNFALLEIKTDKH